MDWFLLTRRSTILGNMKYLLLLLLAAPSPLFASDKPWFRDAGDYIAHRSVRMGMATDPSSKIFSDGKRFDATLGKRLSLYTWGQESPASAWTFGVDAGMLASLQRYSRNNQLTFATNTFDGFFGVFVGGGWDGWIVLLRAAHLSAHLVDNSPRILTPIAYSQFWEEIIVGKSFPHPEEKSDWDFHVQGSVGMNHTSAPKYRQPRAAFGMSFGHALYGPDTLAILASGDVLRAGVNAQRPTYSFFAGIGSLNRPESTMRPFRVGVAFLRGSDYRNQLFSQRQKWTTLEVSTEF